MSGEPRKVIPIPIVTQEPRGPEEETRGCAELEPFALRVLGDSMTPEFEEGHVIVVEPRLSAKHGAYVVAEHDGETVFRQLWIEEGRKFLKPLNAAYATVEITGGFRVRGVVVQRAGRRRSDRKRYD